MVSFLRVDAFRDKLRSICEEEKFEIRFFRPPAIFETFQSNKKLFYGTVTEDSFKLKTNSRLRSTSYIIKGTYSKYNNITRVEHTIAYDKLHYFLVRSWGVLMAVGVFITFMINGHHEWKEMLIICAIPILMTFVSIAFDVSRGKQLELDFLDELDIAPNSKEE